MSLVVVCEWVTRNSPVRSEVFMLSVLLILWSNVAQAQTPPAPVTCVVDGIEYVAATGQPYGCEGGGNWCSGAPSMPGICSRPPNDSRPAPAAQGLWLHAYGACRGSDFRIHSDRIEYLGALEPLGTGRILRTDRYLGGITVQTILAGEGKFLSLWPTEEAGIVAFGYGQTIEQSRNQHCLVQRAPNPQ
jgi:hypothetical protein